MQAPSEKKSKFPRDFAVSVDLVVLTLREQRLRLLTIRRRHAPYRGLTALPGAFVGAGESLEDAVSRTLQEEGGLGDRSIHFEQLASFGAVRRDPRGRVLSVAYLAIAPEIPDPKEGGRETASWTEIDQGPQRWAFDHAQVIQAGLERARAKLEYTTFATRFCNHEFTLRELREVYETVWGHELDPGNFRRKVLHSPGFVVATRKQRSQGSGRPAKLYRAGPAEWLEPPLRRGH